MTARFMDTITAAAACLRDEADVRRAVREIVDDAKADGVVWPGLFQGRLGDYRAAVTAALDAGRATAGELGVGCCRSRTPAGTPVRNRYAARSTCSAPTG